MINSKIIKVCGMMHEENIKAVEQLGIDMMGFIFYAKSPRFVASKPEYLPTQLKKVGVFVNAELQYIKDMILQFELNAIQLHGDESPEFCKEVSALDVEVIKAFLISTEADFESTNNYNEVCNYFLFDTKSDQKGGSGNQFDWQLLNNYQGKTPFLLSGGIAPDSALSLNLLEHPMLAGYDLNSKFEERPGYKSVNNLDLFITKIRHL